MSTENTFAQYSGVEVNVVAEALARAIAQSRKFRNAEHQVAMAWITTHSKPESLAANIVRIGNVSQVRQELEKAGLVANGEVSALAKATGEALDTLAKQSKTAK